MYEGEEGIWEDINGNGIVDDGEFSPYAWVLVIL